MAVVRPSKPDYCHYLYPLACLWGMSLLVDRVSSVIDWNYCPFCDCLTQCDTNN